MTQTTEMFKPKFFTVEFTYADEATPREPQYRTIKANSAQAAKEELLIRSAIAGDRIYVGQAMANS